MVFPGQDLTPGGPRCSELPLGIAGRGRLIQGPGELAANLREVNGNVSRPVHEDPRVVRVAVQVPRLSDAGRCPGYVAGSVMVSAAG